MELGPESKYEGSLRKLVKGLQQQVNVSHLINTFLEKAQRESEHATVQSLELEFRMYIRREFSRDPEFRYKAKTAWNNVIINDPYYGYPIPMDEAELAEAIKARRSSGELLQHGEEGNEPELDMNPNPPPPPPLPSAPPESVGDVGYRTAPVNSGIPVNPVTFSTPSPQGGQLSLGPQPSAPVAAPKVKTVQGLKMGCLTLNTQQLKTFEQSVVAAEGPFLDHMAGTLKHVASEGESAVAFSNLEQNCQAFFLAAKQELIKMQLRAEVTPDRVDEDTMIQAEKNYLDAFHAYELVQELRALDAAGSAFTEEQLSQKLSELGPDNPLVPVIEAVAKAHANHKLPYDKQSIGKQDELTNRSFCAKIADDGKSVSGQVYFSNKDLIHPPKKDQEHKSLEAYETMKTNAHHLITLSLVQAGKGSKDNPFELSSSPPPSNELLVQAIMDLKERAVSEGREFYFKDKKGHLITMGPNLQLTAEEKAYFNDVGMQKSYTMNEGKRIESKDHAGDNVLRHALGEDFKKGQSPAEQWQALINKEAVQLKDDFSERVDKSLKTTQQVQESKRATSRPTT